KSTLSIGLDPETREARPYAISAEAAEELATLSSRLADVMLSLEQKACNDLSLFPGAKPNEGFAWLCSVELAASEKYPLWSDDAALRELAKQAGVAAFSTLDLVEALLKDGRIASDLV